MLRTTDALSRAQDMTGSIYFHCKGAHPKEPVSSPSSAAQDVAVALVFPTTPTNGTQRISETSLKSSNSKVL